MSRVNALPNPGPSEASLPDSHRTHALALAVVLFVVWLLWSGHFTPLLISLGGLSCLSVVLLAQRMRILDEEGVPWRLGLRPFLYAVWLVRQVWEANVDVAGRIIHPRIPISPRLIRVQASQRGDLGRVIFANSITLTPGTVSVDVQNHQIQVHALTREAAAQDKLAEMDRRVTRLEGSR